MCDMELSYPILEIGPKLYVHGEKAVAIAKYADRLSEKYAVQVIFSAQYFDIKAISESTHSIRVFAQHVDGVEMGRGIGAVLPEAVKEAGAVGTLLNHAEKEMTLSEIYKAIVRCKAQGLMSMVCADSLPECLAVAELGADIVLKESREMIGMSNGEVHDTSDIRQIDEAVRRVRPGTIVLHGAGIRDERDVYNVIKAGAVATGVTSAVFTSDDPFEAIERMISAVRHAWNEREGLIGD